MFEIGDKIILKEEYKNTTLSERKYIPQSVVDNMADEIHIVTNVGADSVSYYIEIDNYGYSWNPDMFELVEENYNIKKYQSKEEFLRELEESIIESRLMREGKIPKKSLDDLWNEITSINKATLKLSGEDVENILNDVKKFPKKESIEKNKILLNVLNNIRH